MADRNQRVQVADPTPKGRIEPAARPVDTFTIPGVEKPTSSNPMQELGKALSSMEPQLNHYLVKEKKLLDEKDLADGIESFEKNRVDFKSAIEKGIIPAGASPHLTRGYRLGELRNSARDADIALRQAYETSGLKNSDDPNAVTKFSDEFMQKWQQDHLQGHISTDIVEAFLPKVAASRENIVRHHVTERIKENEKLAISTMTEEASRTITESVQRGESSDVFGPRLKQIAETYIKNGSSRTDVNRYIIDTVTGQAEALNRTDVLEALDKFETTKGSSLGKTSYAIAKMDNARQNIITRQFRDENQQWSRHQRGKELQKDSALNDYVKSVRDAGLNDVDPMKWLKDKGLAGNADVVSAVTAIDKALISGVNNRVVQDNEAFGGLYKDIQKDPYSFDYARIWSGVEAGQWDTNVAMKMHDDLMLLKRNKEHPFTSNPVIKGFHSKLATSIMGDSTGPMFTPQNATTAGEAAYWLDRSSADYLEANPKVRESDYNKFMLEEFQRISKHYQDQGFIAGKESRDIGEPAKPPAPSKLSPDQPAEQPAPVKPPPAALKFLLDNPDTRGEFDKQFPGFPSSNYLD